MDTNLPNGEPIDAIITPTELTTEGQDPSVSLDSLRGQSPRNVVHLPTGHAYQQYRLTASKYERDTLQDWTPRKLSAEEVKEYRLATQRRLDRIRELEAGQTANPKTIPHLEQALYMARLDFRTRFYRIFRINDLPMEILSNTFHLVAWSAPDPRAAILARTWLVSTCRHWRTVATQDSTLWNAIWFRNPPDFKQAYLWLERAANSAIDIRINDSPERPLTRTSASHLIDNVFKKLSNIRILIIVVQDWDPILLVLQSLRQVAEQNIPLILERFELHRAGSAYVQIGAGYELESYRLPVPLFGGARVPSLRYLSLNGVNIDWDSSYLTNLTTFDFRRVPLEKVPSLERFRSILQNSPGLVKLIIDGAGPQWPGSLDRFLNMRPILLSRLKVLVLGDFSLTYGTYFLSQISFPNVVDLTLMNLLGSDYTPFFTRLISSTPSILSLSLNNVGSDMSIQQAFASVKWLQSMPRLSFLRLINIHQSFLDLLLFDAKEMRRATDHTQSLVCPNLAYLEFHTMEVDVIINWARARKALGSPLRKVYIGLETHTKIKAESPEAIRPLFEFMGTATSGNVHVLPNGKRPPEEENLFRLR